ncbi:hypothetical protein OBBRIDRAFT_791776 [Obba rivulosa]|uniref:DUF6533 domain-containing protein n=1 Tax=Obba rivulosa TaxID=1052685 RepID=A0A8E2DN23_9APHY|nr:hypothetical protein OBBRIDRAFT_791776 [Obba rivulosa]
MSTFSPEIVNEVIVSMKSTWIADCCAAACTALVLYHHLTTVSHEVRYMWGRRWNSVTIIFFLNRWTTFVWAIISLVFDLMPLPSIISCKGVTYSQDMLELTLSVLWATFSAIRVYAISCGSGALAILACVLGLVPVGTNIYGHFAATQFQIVNSPFTGPGCLEGENLSEFILNDLTIGTRVAVIMSDLIVLLVTWSKTYAMKREADHLKMKTPLVSMLLLDGTVYFLVLLALNVLQIAATTTNVFVDTANFFITPISSIIISYFLLNLRQAAQASVENNTEYRRPSFVHSQIGEQSLSQQPSVRFASFIDNMGEMLDHGVDS